MNLVDALQEIFKSFVNNNTHLQANFIAPTEIACGYTLIIFSCKKLHFGN